MKDINKMRLGVLREIKNLHKVLEMMERKVKSRNPESIQKSYIFLCHMKTLLDEGMLSSESISLDFELAREFMD